MWVAMNDLPRSAAHPFYTRLNQILDQHAFDGYVEGLCQRFYAGEGKRHRYPPDKQERAAQTVMEQAELLADALAA